MVSINQQDTISLKVFDIYINLGYRYISLFFIIYKNKMSVRMNLISDKE
jgi:hypothetical protein